MLSRTNSRAIRGLLRALRTSPTTTTTTTTTATPASAPIFTSHARLLKPSAQPSNAIRARQYHSTPLNNKGLRPESSEPPAPSPEQPNNVAGGSTHLLEATPISDDLYREYAEEYFNVLQSELEELQETGSDVEAECSAGVLNITAPGIGTYVLNKQPPNKQIWLSSPLSGPKRFDWVVIGDGQHEKQDTRPYVGGQWIYLRDGSNLTTLLNAELGLEMDHNIYEPEE